jgi:hypothetical protein
MVKGKERGGGGSGWGLPSDHVTCRVGGLAADRAHDRWRWSVSGGVGRTGHGRQLARFAPLVSGARR